MATFCGLSTREQAAVSTTIIVACRMIGVMLISATSRSRRSETSASVFVRRLQEQPEAPLATEGELLSLHQQRGRHLARHHLHPAHRVARSFATHPCIETDFE